MNNQTNRSTPVKVLTTNVRTSGAKDGENHWDYRKEYCLEVMLGQDADFICGQEVSPDQAEFLKNGLGEYDFYGLYESATNYRTPNLIFYRRDRFDLIGASGYWLSETPQIPGSRSWESSCIRFANWVHVTDKLNGNRHLRVINCHLDHISHDARVGQARVMVGDSGIYEPDFPQVLTGDLNCDGLSDPLTILRDGGWKDSYGAIHGTETPEAGSFHAFKGDAYDGKHGKIDWVMSRGALKATGAEIVPDDREGQFYSDHNFVSGTFVFV